MTSAEDPARRRGRRAKIVLGALEDLKPALPERPDLPPNLVLR